MKFFKPIIDTACDLFEESLCLAQRAGDVVDATGWRAWFRIKRLRGGKLKEYILKRQTRGILVRVPFPKVSMEKARDKSFIISKLGEAITEASASADENNLNILNLDEYFERLEKQDK